MSLQTSSADGCGVRGDGARAGKYRLHRQHDTATHPLAVAPHQNNRSLENSTANPVPSSRTQVKRLLVWFAQRIAAEAA